MGIALDFRQCTATIRRRPQAAFAAFLAVHLLVWTALPTLLYPNLPLDLIEALTYGREWQLGYDKLPPLPWWLVEILYRLVGVDAAYYLLAQLAVIAAYAVVWTMAVPLVGTIGALISLLIVDGLHYFHYTAAKFNHDVIQLPLWALAGYGLHAGLRRGSMPHWVLLGGAIGLALWAKYFVLVLILPLTLFLLLDPDARRKLATPGPWIALAIALIVMAPHLVWLWRNDFLPFAYAAARAAPARGLADHVIHPVAFALGQFAFLLPALLIAGALFWPRSGDVRQGSNETRHDRARPGHPSPLPNPPPQAGEGREGEDLEVRREAGHDVALKADAFDRRIVTLLVFGPFATTLALSALSGRGTVAMWGYPLWLFLGVWIVLQARLAQVPVVLQLPRVAAVWAVVFVGFALAFITNYSVLPGIDGRYRAVLYPGDRLAEELARNFRAATGRPLAYVIGSMWDGGNVAHYAPGRPRLLIDGDPRRAPWIDLGDLRSKGAVVVWTSGDPDVIPIGMRGVAGDAQIQPPFTLPFRRGDGVLTVGWAILRPQPAYAASVPIRGTRQRP